MLVNHTNKLVLQYAKGQGQFTFSRFDPVADDDTMYDLATAINGFQEPEAKKILKVSVFELM